MFFKTMFTAAGQAGQWTQTNKINGLLDFNENLLSITSEIWYDWQR